MNDCVFYVLNGRSQQGDQIFYMTNLPFFFFFKIQYDQSAHIRSTRNSLVSYTFYGYEIAIICISSP